MGLSVLPWGDHSDHGDLCSPLADENRSHAVESCGCSAEQEVLQRGELSGDYLREGVSTGDMEAPNPSKYKVEGF